MTNHANHSYQHDTSISIAIVNKMHSVVVRPCDPHSDNTTKHVHFRELSIFSLPQGGSIKKTLGSVLGKSCHVLHAIIALFTYLHAFKEMGF